MSEVDDLRRALARSQERLQKTLDLAFDGVTHVALGSRRVVSANAALCRMLGVAEGALEGRAFEDLFAPADREEAGRLLETIAPGRAEIEARLARADGGLAIVELRAIEAEIEGEPSALVTVRDLTERRRLQESLIEAQKMEAVGALAGGVAHDFNNLLGAILGYATYLKRHVRPEDRLYRAVDTIVGASERAAELVRRLLSFSRRAPAERRPFSAAGLIEETVRLFARAAPANVRVLTEVEPGLPSIEGDETQVQQALLNVCLNALDAMHERGGELRVGAALAQPGAAPPPLAAREPRGLLVLSVRDTGPGMTAEVRRRMFEPFFTTKAPGKGTGLGLATAYAIVSAHGGSIEVTSEPGAGTDVRLFLPASDRPPEARRMEQPPERRGAGRVLVVDDEVVIRDLTTDILEERGYEVLLASSGEEAVRRVASEGERVDLVILDLIMPGMNGIETLRRIREVRPGVRVLLSSGYLPDTLQAEVDRSDAVGFVQKPYRVNDLLQAVRTAIAAGRGQRQGS